MWARDLDAAFGSLPCGYSEGSYRGQRYGVSVQRSGDGKRSNLFARQLAGADVVSFNLYRLSSGECALKPCEMSSEKVAAFVLGYAPDAAGGR